jgi:hypothetical protein
MRERTAFAHIYTAPLQPASNFLDHTFNKPIRIRLKKKALRRCWNCRRRRRVENLKVQVFYDSIRFWCKEKCKHG